MNPKHEAWLELVYGEKGEHPLTAYKSLYPNAGHETALVQVSQLKKRYSDKIYESVKDGIRHSTPAALQVLHKLCTEASTEAVKLKAAMAILEYGGHKVERKEISISERSDEEIDTRLKQLLKGDIIEAEVLN